MDALKTETSFRVRYCETDQMGVVHHANYFAWFEMGRTEYCRELGMPYSAWEEQGVMLPVVEVECRYKSPARYDDLITVSCAASELRACSVKFSYEIIRSGTVLATGWTKHGFCDTAGKLIRHGNPFHVWLQDKTAKDD